MEAELYEGIQEVVSVGGHNANFYLGNGYRLLKVIEATTEGTLSEGRPFVKRYPIYVLGRPPGVAHVSHKPPEPVSEEAKNPEGKEGQ